MSLRERWDAFSPRERNLIMGGLVVAVMMVFRYAPIGSDDSGADAGKDDRWIQIQKIENYRRIVARSESADKQTAALLKRYEDQQKRLIDGTTATQVGAELQGLLSTLASDAALNVLSSQILRPEEGEQFQRVGVRLTLSGSLKGITELIASIETGDHDVVVDHFEINRKLGSSRRTPARPGTETQAPLTVSLEVRTFMRKGLES